MRLGIRMKNPAHPGGFVKSEIIEPLGLSVTLSTLLNERSQLSSEMALRIKKAFGVSMDTLMRLQNSSDIAQTRKREGEIDVAPFKGFLADDRPSTAQLDCTPWGRHDN